jgi:hypothetical protein
MTGVGEGESSVNPTSPKHVFGVTQCASWVCADSAALPCCFVKPCSHLLSSAVGHAYPSVEVATGAWL